MDRIVKWLPAVLAIYFASCVQPLCAQPEAMPTTVITSPAEAGSISADPFAMPRAVSPPPQTIGWNGSLQSVSGVSPAAYSQDVYVPTPDPFAGANVPQPPLAPSEPAGVMQVPFGYGDPWSWQFLPDGVIYRDYLADQEEPRFASQNVYDQKIGWLWDVTLGGHVALLRYGSQDPQWPEGWELDMEGAVFPRLDAARQIVSDDFRFTLPLTYRNGPWETRFGYSHLSSHLGDIYIEDNPGVMRINYIREQVILGLGYRPIPDVRLYSEVSWAFHTDGGAKPWEFKFGVEYSPSQPTGIYGAPFLAVNSQIREDLNYSGNVTGEAGWQWRGASGHIFRFGAQYFNGYSDQRQFYNHFEQYFGGGLWYDY